MLNLVQLQERLKNVPMQALMQYANGSNPQVPPFLALGELNRRKRMQENAAADQAKEMEGAPSIKDQIEQSAGQIALQGSRQRQASQQQAGVQANTPMAAPNTTTSEPAQLAGGGFLDDIVVPRDYQGGGQVNLEMLKRLMMKRRPGVAGLPINPNMFKRQDYAGGGIVAFAGPSGSMVEDIVEKETREIEQGRRSGYSDEAKRIMRQQSDQNQAAQADYLKREQQRALESSREIARQGGAPSKAPDIADLPKGYSNEGRAYARGAVPVTPSPLVIPSKAAKELAAEQGADKKPAAGGIASLAPSDDAVRRFLKIDPKEALQDIPETTAEAFRKNLDESNKVFGVSGDPYKEMKRRYGEIEAEDKRTRAEQPMDQLRALLGGIAGGRRGGTFGTQGAEGARASMDLRSQQIALNRKQDLDMAALQGAIAEKEDAINRGDRDRFLAAQQAEREARRNLAKDRLNLQQNQAQMQNQETQARASMLAASRPSAGMEAYNLFKADPKGYEAFRRAGSFGDENFMIRVQAAADKILERDLEYRTLMLSNKPEDRQKAAQKKQDAINQAMREIQTITSGMTGGGGGRIRLDAQGRVISE